MAHKLGIDLAHIHGSGPAGRILIDDLVPHVATGAAKQTVPATPAMDVGKPGTTIPFTGLRRKMKLPDAP